MYVFLAVTGAGLTYAGWLAGGVAGAVLFGVGIPTMLAGGIYMMANSVEVVCPSCGHEYVVAGKISDLDCRKCGAFFGIPAPAQTGAVRARSSSAGV